MDWVQEVPIEHGDQPSLHYKGLRYRGRGSEVSVVGKGYAVVQHGEMLAHLSEILERSGINPRGKICESSRGNLNASLNFFNPAYDIARLIGAIEPGTTCHVGMLVGNSHGAPTSALTLEALASSSDGANYLLGDVLGRRVVRHVGKLGKQVGSLVQEIVAGLPTLGRHIQQARQANVEECGEAILWGLGYGPHGRLAILARKPATAWSLYDACCRFARRLDVGEPTRIGELRRAQGILSPNRRDHLIEAGHVAMLEQAAALEVVRPPEQAALPEMGLAVHA